MKRALTRHVPRCDVRCQEPVSRRALRRHARRRSPSQPPRGGTAAGRDEDRDRDRMSAALANSRTRFILSDIKWANKDKGRARSARPARRAPAAVASATLAEADRRSADVKLTEHVGQTVEVTGTIADKAPSAAPHRPAQSTRPRLRPGEESRAALKCAPRRCVPSCSRVTQVDRRRVADRVDQPARSVVSDTRRSPMEPARLYVGLALRWIRARLSARLTGDAIATGLRD